MRTPIVHLFAKNVRKRDTPCDIRRHIHVVLAKKLAAQEYSKRKTYSEQRAVERKNVERVLARKPFIIITEWLRLFKILDLEFEYVVAAVYVK